ncbi:MAG: type IV toxin-antitoxin system AbiEi family antitoxin [Coriobacteriia bacterium]
MTSTECVPGMTGREVTKTLAPLLQELELEQPRVVTKVELRSLADAAGITWPIEVAVRRLRERGWLLDLKTRGVWEFAPAARAGSFGSGDPLIELRAVLARDSRVPFAVAGESAAYLLGLTSRRPDREVVGAPEGIRLPRALSAMRAVHWVPRTKPADKDGLPVWSISTLISFMAAQPSGYRDWPNVGEWIAQAARETSAEAISEELSGHPRAAWARAAYLLDAGGRADIAARLLDLAPPGTGPYYLGNRRVSGRYSKTYDVVDSTGMEVRCE